MKPDEVLDMLDKDIEQEQELLRFTIESSLNHRRSTEARRDEYLRKYRMYKAVMATCSDAFIKAYLADRAEEYMRAGNQNALELEQEFDVDLIGIEHRKKIQALKKARAEYAAHYGTVTEVTDVEAIDKYNPDQIDTDQKPRLN